MKVSLEKNELLNKIRENLAAHEEAYEQAMIVWREEVTELLEAKLNEFRETGELKDDARRNSPASYVMIPPRPVKYVDSYNRAIRMLTDHSIDVIELEDEDYAKFVLDDWEWSGEWAANTASYSGKFRSR